MTHSPSTVAHLLPTDLRADVVPVDLDGEILLLDARRSTAVRLDAAAVARIGGDDAARQSVFDALHHMGLCTTGRPGGMSRRGLITAAAAIGVTMLVLPDRAAASSGPTTTAAATTTTTSPLPAGGFVNVNTAPNLVTVSPDGTKVYVACYGGGLTDGTVSVIDTSTNSVTTFIGSVGGGGALSGPWIVIPSPDGTRLYVTNNMTSPSNPNQTRTKVFNASTGALLAVIEDPEVMPLTTAVMSADGTRLYVVINTAITGGNAVSVIDTDPISGSYHTQVARITGFNRPYGAAVTGSRLYVTNNGNASLRVIDTGTNTQITTISVGTGPRNLAITPDGTRAYVPNATDGTVSVVDTDPTSGTYHTVTATIAGFTDAHTVAFAPDGTRAYVSLKSQDQVKVIDTDPASGTYNTVTGTLTVGDGPGGLVVRPDGQRLYVANALANTVSVLSTS